MTIGLTEEQIIIKLQETGLSPENVENSDRIRTAIAIVIAENNRLIEKQVSEVVANKWGNELKKMGIRI